MNVHSEQIINDINSINNVKTVLVYNVTQVLFKNYRL